MRWARILDTNPDVWDDSLGTIADAPADCLRDFRTNDNEFSLWEEYGGLPALRRVIAAFATTQEKGLRNLTVVTFDESALTAVGVALDRVPGDTADAEANERWHLNVHSLSAVQVAAIVNEIWKRFLENDGHVENEMASKMTEFSVVEIATEIADGIGAERVDRSLVKPNVIKVLRQYNLLA